MSIVLAALAAACATGQPEQASEIGTTVSSQPATTTIASPAPPTTLPAPPPLEAQQGDGADDTPPVAEDPATRIRTGPSEDTDAYAYVAWTQDGKLVRDPSLSTVSFSTPSKNIVCYWSSGSGQLACGLNERSPLPPSPPGDCGETTWQPKVVTLDNFESVRDGVCAGGLMVPFAANVLPYGSVLRSGDFGCLSAENGVTCIVLSSGRGFTVNRSSLVELA